MELVYIQAIYQVDGSGRFPTLPFSAGSGGVIWHVQHQRAEWDPVLHLPTGKTPHRSNSILCIFKTSV
ncbi:hypothetical protein PHLCEN_2v6029 [Hermanssonia centrifuga]|uniref:Uncharacterized protein n=1 Tax=Hermanssonia centrifuga TaxID=98765 RepID=A0A2R6P0N6_9APHY|nr:hypothetical protein PHLCEN_2v6029 [Hermanssonia centrifuga]